MNFNLFTYFIEKHHQCAILKGPHPPTRLCSVMIQRKTRLDTYLVYYASVQEMW